jgi:glycosyltransferase involved in cell wall biosynthesis
MSNALVITPTTGRTTLVDAVKSVQAQTVPADHIIVVDGPEYIKAVSEDLIDIDKSNIHILPLPFNTGQHNFWGHRIIAAMSQIVNHDYVFVLDDDDWYDPNHIESMINTMQTQNLDWAFALRKVWTFDQDKYLYDYSTSIGNACDLIDPDKYIVSTSSYGFTNDFIRQHGNRWYGNHGADQQFYRNVGIQHPHASTNLYTVNYRLDWKNSEEDIELIRIASGAHEHCQHRHPSLNGAYAALHTQ